MIINLIKTKYNQIKLMNNIKEILNIHPKVRSVPAILKNIIFSKCKTITDINLPIKNKTKSMNIK